MAKRAALSGQMSRPRTTVPSVELLEIIARYAEAIEAIDASDHVPRFNQRTGEQYLAGVKSMSEAHLVRAIDEWWGRNHPEDFTPPGEHRTEVPYPAGPRGKCDQVLTTDGDTSAPEWAIEVKYPQLVGNNGKRNDFAVGKTLSPYRKDRSLHHDVERLRENPMGRRCAVVVICFSYTEESCARALELHPGQAQTIAEIEDVCRQNGGNLLASPLAEFADGILRVRQLVRASYVHQSFEAWRHPCGGRGVVFGWEVRLGESDGDRQW